MSRINPGAPLQPVRRVQAWLAGWWQLLLVGAALAVLALSARGRQQALQGAPYARLYNAVAPMLAGYTVATALASLVIIRIVIVTAQSYGLSQYALELLIRTLVLELLPLSVALFVAVRYTMPQGEQVRAMRQRGELDAMWRAGGDPARDLLLPRVGAGVFAVMLLAAVSCVVTLVLTYLSVYGFKAWGLAGYTRSVGQVFSPVVTLIFCLKTVFFSLAVSVVPIVYAPPPQAGDALGANAEIKVLTRLFSVILLMEAISLLGNYY